MIPISSSGPLGHSAEIAALIETLQWADQRLEELTAGEVDTVANREGRTFLLQRTQDQLRLIEAARQMAILDALPAHIALLNAQGDIVSVNQAWQRFAQENAPGTNTGVGSNYLAVCDVATGNAIEARSVAAGIRGVLLGEVHNYSIEYPCDTSTGQRWFLMTVTPLAADRLSGAIVMHLDVSSQRRAAQSLAVSESRFRQMADHITDVFFLQSLDGTEIYYVSPAFELIWGRSCESLYANPMSWADAIHPDYLQYALSQVRDGSKTGVDYEFRIIRPDGEIRWVHTRGFPIFDASGVPYLTAGVCTDITERKQAENDLRKSEARFRSLTDLSSDWYWEQDEEHQFSSFSDSELVRAWGSDQFSLIGKCRWDLPGATPLQGSWHEHKALLDARKPFRNFEYRCALENGGFRYITTSGEPVFDASGRFTGYRGVGTDITERKLATDELRESEGLKRAILESSLDCIVTIDCEGKIVEFNAAAETTFGWTRAQALGKTMVDLIVPPHLRTAHRRGFAHYLATGVGPALGRRLELTAIRADGTEFPVELAITPIGGSSRPMFTGFIRDITESQQAKEEILHLNADLEHRVQERTFELEAANRELEAFDYSVAHDLRAPIRHIEGFGAVLMEEYSEKLDARGRDYLQRIRNAGGRMEQLVTDLLALSMVSRCDINRGKIDLSELALLVFAELQDADPAREIEHIVAPGLVAHADRGQLRIVLENLIGNAWKFTGKQGSAKIEVGCSQSDHGPAFFVRDNGAGFDAAYADRLFAPFQRLHKQSDFKGTGIGLATVRRIITRHGGRVWAEGIAQRGATFYFTLPQ